MNPLSDTFDSTRPLLFSIAYRMLGSVMDAEDVVQDAYLRWQDAPEAEVRSPRAYLTTIVTRLAINQLRSARHRREAYVGPWLPEPLVTETVPDPSGSIELAESLSMAFLVLLERLSPIERAVFLLREVFDFDYAEIGRIVDKSEVNCRQLFARAKKHVGATRARFAPDEKQASRLVAEFTRATNDGDVEGLVALLAEDITLWADGGGQVPGAARKPVHGRDAVARFVIGTTRRFVGARTNIRAATINGQPGFIAYAGTHAQAALIFDIRDGHIKTVYAIGNPEKLASLPPEH